MKNKFYIFLSVLLFLGVAGFCFAHLPRIVYTQTGDVTIEGPENSQAFYDELTDAPKNYLISSEKDFILYLNLLVPAINGDSRYSANIFLVKDGVEEKVAFVDGQTDFTWQEYYEEFGRDYYYKGPEFEQKLSAGNYKIEIFSYANKGKYVLAVGKNEVFPILETVKVFWTLPMLKMQFFKTSVVEFAFTIFGKIAIGVLGLILLLIAFLIFISSVIKSFKDRKPKMLLLTSSGMSGSREYIMAILPKPAEDIRVAHIITASKYKEDNRIGVERNRQIMIESGFNVEEIDIEGKNYEQLLKKLSEFDIIFVNGGNTFYLLKHMRACNFKKIMKKLFRKGIIYIGESAGSIVAGKNIEIAKWLGDENIVHMSYLNFSGLNFVPFNIMVHFDLERGEIIKKKIPNPKKRKNLKIITDQQAIFVLGKEITFVGSGEVVDPQSL
jgi:peptidase E